MERIALVTGGCSGIGRAAVQALAEAGWYVCFTCRDIVRGETAAEAVRAVGGSCEAFRADLADTAASRALVAQLTERFGRLDVLVNCAGISNTKSIEEIDEAEWDTMLNVNLRGTFFLTQAAFRPARWTRRWPVPRGYRQTAFRLGAWRGRRRSRRPSASSPRTRRATSPD